MSKPNNRDVQTGGSYDLGYDSKKNKSLTPAHKIGVAAVGVVAIVVAFYVLSSLAGIIMTVVKIAVIVGIIYLVIKFLTGRKSSE